MSDLVGKEIGPYRILAKIAGGGMSTVYKGVHSTLNRYAAIKVMSEQMGVHEELRQRFRQEVRVVTRLEHAYILPIYDYGLDGSQLYLAMRYIETGTLRDRLAQGPMGPAELRRVVHQVCAALAYAHSRGVVHRDIKPTNVLIDAQGDCFLADFGLAKTAETSLRLTATGVGLGSPAYMSPEQGTGAQIDARSDIYSLGVVLYEMVTGQVPYRGNSPVAVMLKHISDPIPHPSDLNPALPPELEAVIVKALAKKPEERFQTVDEMLHAFDTAVGLSAQAPNRPPAREQNRLPVWVQAVVWSIVLVGIVSGAILFSLVASGRL